ncbi:MAG: ROK family glucokinase [Lachnospiraceae bacterium]|nr:ROK family glucokinase [Lachnospiraceae bacterium]
MGKYVFGVDIGGTTVKIGLLTTAGEMVDKWEIVTRKEDKGANILPDVAASIEAKLKERSIDKSEVEGIGIGVPGPVTADGIVLRAVNLGWGRLNIAEKMEELTGIKSNGGNDANVAALGEMWKGGGMGFNSIVMVTLGTGVGGGIIIDGKILTGARGAGGEIGHIHVKDGETRTCGCGNHGCFEQYASATGLSFLASEQFKAWKGNTCLTGNDLSAKAVFDGVKAGDELCKNIAKEYGDYLGKGLAVITSTIDPEAIVIGGGVSKAGQILIDYLKPAFNETVFGDCRDVEIKLATLGNDAGMYGAAKLVL